MPMEMPEAVVCEIQRLTDIAYRCCKRAGMSDGDAEVVQGEVLFALLRHFIVHGTLPVNSDAFVRTIARRRIWDWIRKLRQRGNHWSLQEFDLEVPATDAIDPVDVICKQEDSKKLTEAIKQLPDHYREPLVLYYFNDMSIQEIAEALGRPVGTVTVQLARARSRLATLLTQTEDASEIENEGEDDDEDMNK